MDRAVIESLYAASTIPKDELKEIFDKVEEFRMTGMFNRIVNSSPSERDIFLRTSVKENIQRQENRKQQLENRQIKKGKEEIDSHIKSEMLKHLEAIRRASNLEITSEKDYETACLLKAFAIEYMLKIINIMSNTSKEKEKQFANGQPNTSQLIGSLMKDARDKLAISNPGKRFTGHEINDLLNSLIPEQIRTLIKYKAITNFVDPNVREEGTFVNPATGDSSMENFVADYFLLIKDFTEEQYSSTQSRMSEIAAAHNQNYAKNNKAFEAYRYRDKEAGFCDYNMLNSLMVSTQMILTFLLENRDLAQNIQNGETIPYEAVSSKLTKEEYEHLLELSNQQSYDSNSLIYYHSFLKQYLKDRTPRLTDERYARINKLFTEIKNASDISLTGETFAEWFKNIKIDSLTPEELKELKVIAPEFIYNSLSYSDKLIFKKCQEKGIEFEYYYKMEPEKFDKIVSIYGHLFQGGSIDIKLLRKSLTEIPDFINTLKSVQINLSTIPSYYYDYSTDVIREAHKSKKTYTKEELKELGITSNDVPSCVSKRDLDTAHIELMAERLMDDEEISLQSATPEEISESLQRIFSSLIGLEELKMKRESIAKAKLLQLEAGIKSGTITEENCTEEGYNVKDFHKVKMMIGLSQKYKTDSIEPFYGMSPKELNDKFYSLIWYTDLQNCHLEPGENYSALNPNDFPLLVLKKCPQVERMMNEGIEVNPSMKFLKINEVATNYVYVQREDDQIPMGDYLLYKTPEEVKEIIALCHECSVDFQPEFLYYDMDILKDDLYRVEDSIDAAKATLAEGEMFNYETAQNITERMRARNLRRNRQQSREREQPYHLLSNEYEQMSELDTTSSVSYQPSLPMPTNLDVSEEPNNELNNMINQSSETIVIIPPAVLAAVNKAKTH